MSFSMEGVIPPVITPYKEDQSIDFDGFQVLIEHLVEQQVHAVIVGGTTGEYFLHSIDERLKLIELARQVLRGRIPLIAGVGGIQTQQCIEIGLAAKARGADGILISSPFYALPTQQELASHSIQIAQTVDLPVMLYNYPGRTGTCMEREYFQKITQYPQFKAIKESSGEITNLHMLVQEFPELNLFCGADDQALEFFAWGASGWVCGAGTALPKEHIALFETCVAQNDIMTGRQIMLAMLPFLQFLENYGKFIQSVKFTCALENLPAGPVRRPLEPLSELEMEKLTDIVKTMNSTISEILANRY